MIRFFSSSGMFPTSAAVLLLLSASRADAGSQADALAKKEKAYDACLARLEKKYDCIAEAHKICPGITEESMHVPEQRDIWIACTEKLNCNYYGDRQQQICDVEIDGKSDLDPESIRKGFPKFEDQ